MFSLIVQEECVGAYVDGEGQEVSRMWRNLHFNFDDIGNAFLTLFITATLDGYTPAMYMSMSTRLIARLAAPFTAHGASCLQRVCCPLLSSAFRACLPP